MENDIQNKQSARYFSDLVSHRNLIVKLQHADLIISPETDDRLGFIGFRANVHAKAGKLEGRMDIDARFSMPENTEIKISAMDELLNEMIEGMEFIKCGGQYPHNETIHSLGLKVNKND